MSGIEVAGIVLGAIPIILAGLQFYIEGISVTRRYRKYEDGIKDLVRQLGTEYAIYANSVKLVLNGVVKQKDIALFLAKPTSEQWKDPNFEATLQERLGTSYDSFVSSMQQLAAIVERFKKLLRLDASGKPLFTDKGTFKEHYKRFRFSLKISYVFTFRVRGLHAELTVHLCHSDYKELMTELRQTNWSLHILTTQASTLPIGHDSHAAAKQLTPNFSLIKDHALTFHAALSNSWSCTCQVHHNVNLRLESRIENRPCDNKNGRMTSGDAFHVLFRYEHEECSAAQLWTWKEADARIKHVGTSTAKQQSSRDTKSVRFATETKTNATHLALEPETTTHQIKDLCSAIIASQRSQRGIGFSLLADVLTKQKCEILLITPVKPFLSDTASWSVSSPSFLDLLTEFNTADRMAEALWSEAGAKYSNAVRRCIRCDFNQRASSLEDRKFQEAVFRGVVAQLQENYEYLF
ncbi:hypothetical protein SNOG_01711 [Parastagonospora nodorum SN15]|uniref:Uncharacterized protein n=1 Tax=Phaeosphaeria nodorum (strain SN15 / ATCC MYA-4574 / FGSC 10173) TaxID=321614 RepID=Q0V2Q3_PHANO|nr:hypothetical protein SNOG_01711 [Parastagonospora nodorum SN15]EAT91360.1 hypothetical protein SNOG_01711 [Parastagonospora nodorum SN15]